MSNMFRKAWHYFLLTMGVTPKGEGRAGEADKWAGARRKKEALERAEREREEKVLIEGADAQRVGERDEATKRRGDGGA